MNSFRRAALLALALFAFAWQSVAPQAATVQHSYVAFPSAEIAVND